MLLYGIVGDGGCAREVMPVALEMLVVKQQTANCELVFVVEPGGTGTINGQRAITTEEFLASKREKYFNIAIADPQLRERLAIEFIAAGAIPFSISARNSVIMGDNKIGEGAILCPFTTITVNVMIGKFFHANIYSYVTHDCQIGDFVTFAPNVHCNGRVVIEDKAYIGAGATIKQGTDAKPIIIGRESIVGMGAVVTKSVEPFTTVVGNPAAPIEKERS